MLIRDLQCISTFTSILALDIFLPRNVGTNLGSLEVWETSTAAVTALNYVCCKGPESFSQAINLQKMQYSPNLLSLLKGKLSLTKQDSCWKAFFAWPMSLSWKCFFFLMHQSRNWIFQRQNYIPICNVNFGLGLADHLTLGCYAEQKGQMLSWLTIRELIISWKPAETVFLPKT